MAARLYGLGPQQNASRTRALAMLFIAIGMVGLYVVEFGRVEILSRCDISIVKESWMVGFFA